MKKSPRAAKAGRIVLLLLVAGHVIAAGFYFHNTRDRNPGYRLDLDLAIPSGALSAGFSAVRITPDITEPWRDEDGDSRFDEDLDSWEDRDGDGEFDGVWLAGFNPGRPATGVHDDLWARTMVIDNGVCRISITALDAIGFFHDDVIAVRELLPESANLTYSIIASTHVHEGPDLLGLWGRNYLSGGVNPDYLKYVKRQAVESIVLACRNLRPARLRVFEDPVSAEALVRDSRLPIVKDPTLKLLQAVDSGNGETLGITAFWADHPETLWSGNLEITSDFPHYFREGLEKGIPQEGELKLEGPGGIAIYLNGAIGGLLTTDPSLAIEHPFSGERFTEPSFAKAEAQGSSLALAAIRTLEGTPEAEFDAAGIGIQASTLELPLDNPLYIAGSGLGLLRRGHSSWLRLRTEIAALSIGPLSFLCLPGEVYPEIVYGGITAPEGRDFPAGPVETPALYREMPGRCRFVIGLANDEIGYIIPRSEWDDEAPNLYGRKTSPYGEINSLGPETGPLVHRKALELIRRLAGTPRPGPLSE